MKTSDLKYLLALGVLFLLPPLELIAPARSRSAMYMTLPGVVGSYGTVERDIFEDNRNADIVVLGSSSVIGALDPAVMKSVVQAKTGAEPIVHFLAYHESGADIQYVMLNDYLKTHTPKVVVLPTPWRVGLFKGPSMSVAEFCNFSDYGDLTQGLSLKDKFSIYCQMALYSPRELFDSIEHRKLTPEEKTDEARHDYVAKNRWPISFGKNHTATEQYDASQTIPAHVVKLSALDPDPSGASSYVGKFYDRIQQLLSIKKIPLVLVYLPETSDIGKPPQIAANSPLSGLPGDVPVIYSDLLQKPWLPSQPKQVFYDDIHLNGLASGAFTRSITDQLCSYLQLGARS